MCCACCRMQDQVIVFLALAGGRSTVLCGEPTLHTRTAIAVAEQLTAARFTVSRVQHSSGQGPWTISCQGAGITTAGAYE